MARKPKDVWGIPLPSPKDVVDYFNNAVSQARTASGDSQAKPGTSDFAVRNLGRGVSMINDSVNPYANTTKQLLGVVAGNPDAEAKFAKSLAKDIAITAAGVGVGKVAGKGITAAQKATQTNPNVKAAIARATSIPESISYAAKTNPSVKAATAKYSDLPGYISNARRRSLEVELNIRNHPYFIDSGGYGAKNGVAGFGREPGVANNIKQFMADQKLRKKLKPYEEVLVNDDMVLIQAAKIMDKAAKKEFKNIIKRF
jgi:hypothetical protein